MMPTFLFTYGTLMNLFDSAIARFLQKNSTFRGAASVPGRLYDLGQYPGLWFDNQSETRVRGQVFELIAPELALPVLDHYEMVDPLHPESGEYRREQIWVKGSENEYYCWAYLLNGPLDGFREITSGDYATYILQNHDHQNFINST